MARCAATTRGGGGGARGVDEPCIFMNYIIYREVSKLTIEFWMLEVDFLFVSVCVPWRAFVINKTRGGREIFAGRILIKILETNFRRKALHCECPGCFYPERILHGKFSSKIGYLLQSHRVSFLKIFQLSSSSAQLLALVQRSRFPFRFLRYYIYMYSPLRFKKKIFELWKSLKLSGSQKCLLSHER